MLDLLRCVGQDRFNFLSGATPRDGRRNQPRTEDVTDSILPEARGLAPKNQSAFLMRPLFQHIGSCSFRPTGSKPVVGFVQISNSGSWAIAWAILVRCRMRASRFHRPMHRASHCPRFPALRGRVPGTAAWNIMQRTGTGSNSSAERSDTAHPNAGTRPIPSATRRRSVGRLGAHWTRRVPMLGRKMANQTNDQRVVWA